MTLTDVVVGLVILIGIAGIIVPILPGSILILVAIAAWAFEVQTSTGWAVFAVASVFLLIGAVVKYIVPRNQLKEAGVPTSTMALGAVGALVGLFVIPYVGLFVGFVLGIYLGELIRLDARQAWPSTWHALKAVGFSIMIELAAALLATATWTIGVVAT